jgi:ABC-type multidrug transport system fused ATPase/permease subunit
MSVRSVLVYFRDEWSVLAATTALALFGALFDAVSVVLIVGLADAVSREADRVERTLGPVTISMPLGTVTVLAIVAVTLSVLAVVAIAQLRAGAVAAWVAKRRLALLNAFIDTDWSVQSRDRAGALQAEVSYVTYASSLLSGLITAARGGVGLLVLVGAAFMFHVAAAALILVLGATIALVLRPINRAVKMRSAESAVELKRLSEEVGEASQLAREIRVFGVEEQFRERLSAPVAALGNAERRVVVLSSLVTPIYQAMAMTVIVLGLYTTARFTSIDAGLLGVIALLMLRSVSYGQQLQNALTTLHQAAPTLDVIDATLTRLRSSASAFGNKRLGPISAVALADVEFSYEGDHLVLKGVSTTFARGEIVGLVGSSGAGKSTLAQIVLRLREAQRGAVTVNGQPTSSYDSGDWTRAVSLVPQDTYLLHGSVSDNIAFLRPWISHDQVVHAAESVGLHETICALPSGYDTMVGPGARELSGGQRQRLGIARALAGKPSVVVLDEPTSALDHLSEAAIQETLSMLRGRALVIVIAHRLSTLAICDRVIVLADGVIDRETEPGSVAGALPHQPFDLVQSGPRPTKPAPQPNDVV